MIHLRTQQVEPMSIEIVDLGGLLAHSHSSQISFKPDHQTIYYSGARDSAGVIGEARTCPTVALNFFFGL